jgi:hypothetical protein
MATPGPCQWCGVLRDPLALAEARERREKHCATRFWTNPQRQLFDSPYRLTVSWGANGIGKSVGAAELCRRALAGELYWQPKRRNGRTVILCGKTWSQVGVTLGYFWELVDPRWFREKIRFEGGRLMGQRLAVFDIVAGPGKGGQLRCGTFNAENLAGPRAEVVITDEPLPENVHNELWPRLFGRGGRMYETFTPTMGTSHKLDYLWTLVDDETKPYIGEIQTELTLDAVTPRGGLYEIPWVTTQEIEELVGGMSAAVRAIRTGRSRTPEMKDAYYSAWGDHLRIDGLPPWMEEALNSGENIPIGVGIDHGSKPGAQRAVLVAVLRRGIRSRVHVLDEYTGDGRTESEEDAQGIIDMLRRNRLKIQDVDQWVGDRAHGGFSGGGKKSNFRLMQAIAETLGISTSKRGWIEKLPKTSSGARCPLASIKTPYKRDRSVFEGADIIHRLMVKSKPDEAGQDYYTVDRKCEQLDQDHREWRGGKNEPAKDGCDAERYIVVPMVEGSRH